MRKLIDKYTEEFVICMLFLAAFHLIKIGYDATHEISVFQLFNN